MGSGEKIIDILKILAKSPYEYGVTEISNLLGCGKSGVYKHLRVLLQEGMVAQNKNRKYSLGLSSYLIGKAYEDHVGVAKFCRPHIERLRDLTDENASFGVWVDDSITMLYKIESRQAVRVVGGVGGERRINASAIGKTLAAYVNPDKILRIIQHTPLERFTDKTITDIDAFFLDLEQVRQRGYAISDEEFLKGTIGIGAPIFDEGGKVWAAVSLGAPKVRMGAKKLEKSIALVLETAKAITDEYCGSL